MKTLRATLLLLLVLPFAAQAGRTAALVDPAPIEVPGKLSVAKVEAIVKESLIARDWAIKEKNGGEFVAQFEKSGRHKAKIGIRVDARSVTIRYLDSLDLNYSEGGGERQIHANYNKWIANLVKDISVRMSAAAF